MQVSSYKKEIISGILGALLAGVLSLTIGIYNLNKSFEMAQKKDILYSLKTDIALLKERLGDRPSIVTFQTKPVRHFTIHGLTYVFFQEISKEVA